MFKPETTYTVEQFIDAGAAVTLTYQNLSFAENINDTLVAPIFNVIDDYLPELKTLCMTIEFTDEEFLKYAYKPKLLAYDIYKNTELFFVIMALNGICDIREFNKKKIKMLTVNQMNELLTFIYNANKKAIDIYNDK